MQTIKLPTTARPTVDQATRDGYKPHPLSARLLGIVPDIIRSPLSETIPDQAGTRFACRLATGQIYYDGQLAVDADGSSLYATDPKGRPGTSWQPAGVPLDGDRIPFFSVKISFFNDPLNRLKRGDFAVVMRHQWLAFAVLGDVGGSQLGEGSLQLHRDLKHERVHGRGTADFGFWNSSIPADVITIVFPGSGDGLDPTKETIATKTRPLWHNLLATRLDLMPMQHQTYQYRAPPKPPWPQRPQSFPV